MSYQHIFFGNSIELIIEWLNNQKLKKMLIVTGKSSYEMSGAKDYLQPILNQFSIVQFSDFKENPNIEDVYKGIDILNTEKCDCCIAIGGGSVMDMAKLICYLEKEETKNAESVAMYKLSTLKRELPLCVIPTTAGSGAESTHFAVVYINEIKYSLANQSILPDIVNLNPHLSFTMTPYLKAISGLDGLAQGIESFWSKNATIESREYSTQAITLIWNNLKQSVLFDDYNAHKEVVKGSNLAGKAINIAKTTACHAFSYYFTTKHNIKHGHAVSLTLGKVYQFNYQKSLDSDNIRKQLFIDLNELIGIKENPCKTIEQFISDLNIELDYIKLNINIDEELSIIAKEVNNERLNNNPFKIENTDYKELLITY